MKLDDRIRELIAVGTSVGANCHSCLEYHVGKAREQKGKKYHRVERTYGAFMRSFTLPEDASGEKLNADFKDGILKVHIPKEESAKTKAIEVKVS